MMRMLLFFVLVFFFYSCQDVEEVKRPDNLLSEQKMVDVLTELSILNAAKNYNKRMLESKGVQPDKFLYEKHNIDSLQLAQSTQYYAKNYNRLEFIYERVKQNLEEMKREFEERQEKEKQQPDSLGALNSRDSIRQNLKETPADSVLFQRLRPKPIDSLGTPENSVDF